MKILLGWELGAGQGHIQRLVSLAQGLELQGHTPVFALKSYDLQGRDFPWSMHPSPPLPFSGREDSYSYTDLLAAFGFDQPLLLSAHLQAWQDLLQTIAPALVIADHAPGLVLAAHNRVPTVVVGSYFAVPPPVDLFPLFRFPASPEVDERQAKVYETVSQLVSLRSPLGQVLNGDRSFISGIPEIDCYRAWRINPQYVGIHNAPIPRSFPTEHSVWSYLSQDYPLKSLVIQTLNAAQDFIPLETALVNQSLVVHHGGLTTTVGCLLAGVPQVILPRHLEQELNAFSLMSLEVGQMQIAPTWESLLTAQIQGYQMIQTAQCLADRLSIWNHNFTDQIIKDCMALFV
jgi:UDP:flavonoid glycosyltransferase YjiC (YdhE family)